jgi:3-isopropylmalate/(R)-2-methylmalate dehydratase small subunit
MDPLTVHTGQAVVLRRGDVDTDQIIPVDYCRLPGRTGFDKGLFARWRTDPGFVLNDPAMADRTILLAGPRFGTGSSREHAVWALRNWGFAVVIAPSFGDIFARNALHNRLLVVRLDVDVVEGLMATCDADPTAGITVDLAARDVSAAGGNWHFEIDERARWLLLNGYDDIELTSRSDTEISAYEHRRPAWLPRVGPTGQAVAAAAAPVTTVSATS